MNQLITALEKIVDLLGWQEAASMNTWLKKTYIIATQALKDYKEQPVFSYIKSEQEQQLVRMKKIGINTDSQIFEQCVNTLLAMIEQKQWFEAVSKNKEQGSEEFKTGWETCKYAIKMNTITDYSKDISGSKRFIDWDRVEELKQKFITKSMSNQPALDKGSEDKLQQLIEWMEEEVKRLDAIAEPSQEIAGGLNYLDMHIIPKAKQLQSLSPTETKEVSEDGWVSVEDRLPEYNTPVLTFIGNTIVEGFYNSVDGWCQTYIGNTIIPTHWMYLPSKPKTK